jgi:hypothetical protein
MIHTRLKQLYLHQHKLIIQALQLLKKGIDQGEGIVVGLLLHIDGNQTCLEVLPKERSSLGDGPFYA